MFRRRAIGAGIATKIGNHTFRATGITGYLKNGGTLENAAAMANHASTRTTHLYDRRRDDVSLNEVERIPVWRSAALSRSVPPRTCRADNRDDEQEHRCATYEAHLLRWPFSAAPN